MNIQTRASSQRRHVSRMVATACVLTGLVLAGSGIAAAQDNPDTPLTLAAAVDLALRNHPATREAHAAAAAAVADVAVARTAYLPRLDALWQVNRATRNNVFGLLLPQSVVPPVSGPVLSESLDSVWSSAGGLLLSWEAVDFGRRRATVDVARAESGAAEAQGKATELEIASAAADAYLAVLATNAALDAAQANVERLNTFATSVRALVQNQLRAGAELSRAEAELATAKNRLTEARRNADLARLALADAVGRPGARIVLAAGPLPQPPAPPTTTTSFTPALHPNAVAASAQADIVRARAKVLARSYFPRVDLQTAVSGRGVSRQIDGSASGSGLALEVPNWAVGVSVTFPAFELFRTQAKRRVETERLGEATARYDRTIQALQTQEARARTVIAAAYEIAANTPLQLQAAREGDAQARARYDAGLTNVLEVAESQRLLAEAEAESAVATLAVWRSLLADAVLRGDIQPFLTLMHPIQPTTSPTR
ncbi:MAG: TolC family protein [Vicinamibacterales bacterium]